MSNSIAYGWQPVAAQQIKVHLKPGEQHKLVFILGYSENPADDKFDPPGSQTLNKLRVTPVIERYLQKDEVENSFQQLRAYWQGLLGKFQVATPDIHTDHMINVWNICQVMATYNFSRSAS